MTWGVQDLLSCRKFSAFRSALPSQKQ